MLGSLLRNCCNEAAFRNAPFCPVCRKQMHEHHKELKRAAEEESAFFSLAKARERSLHAQTRHLPLGKTGVLHRGGIVRYPARLAVFKLYGIYLPEREAQAVLREIHNYKWFVAEKAGKDVWQERAPENPFSAAAQEWGRRYLETFLDWLKNPLVCRQGA